MVSDSQVKQLLKALRREGNLRQASLKAGMDRKTGRKYARLGRMPSQREHVRGYRTREDPFRGVWEEIRRMLDTNAGWEARTLFGYLQRRYPGRFEDGQVRTLQRRVKAWRATEGPGKEVFFPQEHRPGQVCESDFTHMGRLGITVGGQAFPHLLYHLVLPYSNWETGTICFGESYESLSEGLQNGLWELGGVPEWHRTDRLSVAVHQECSREEFTARYEGLMRHYGMKGQATQAGKAHEKGDVEQRHRRYKDAVGQALLLRGSGDFASREEYAVFLAGLFRQLNAGRRKRLAEELAVLRPLPSRRLDDRRWLKVRVGPSSTIRALHNVYSVHSRLIGEWVQVRVSAEELELWYGQRAVDRLPRMRGEYKSRINYRHIIGWLVRKPGAFAQYRYREELFPSTTYRLAYDRLRTQNAARADREYLKVLELAARRSERGVESILRLLLETAQSIEAKVVAAHLESEDERTGTPDVEVPPVPLAIYDVVLSRKEALECRP